MSQQERVIAYFDGSNFYHLCKINFGKTNIDLGKISQQMLKPNELLTNIRYFNSPINQQEEPEKYSKQQRFFSKLKENSLTTLHLGRLVKRPINKIKFNWVACCLRQVESLQCPICNKARSVSEIFKTTEKGVDVLIAIQLILDALEKKFDSALLFSGDADLVPAIKHITEKLNKKVVFCSFP